MKKMLLLFVALSTITVCAQGDSFANTKTENLEEVFRSTDVDLKPQLKNGINEFSAFIGNNFKFPEIKNKKIKIFVSFIVEKNGSMTDAKAFYISVKDLISDSKQTPVETEAQKASNAKESEQFKSEAVRVIKAFTEKWIPAKKNGQFVRCLYNYSINFNIE